MPLSSAVTRSFNRYTDLFVTKMASRPSDIGKPTAAELRRQVFYVRRQARYKEAARMYAAGVAIKRIAGGARLWRKPPCAGFLMP